MAYLLLAVSLAAFAFAARLAWQMLPARPVDRERLARAVRPAEGRPIMWEAPARSFNRPGEN